VSLEKGVGSENRRFVREAVLIQEIRVRSVTGSFLTTRSPRRRRGHVSHCGPTREGVFREGQIIVLLHEGDSENGKKRRTVCTSLYASAQSSSTR